MIIDFHTHTFPKKIAEHAINKLSKQSNLHAYTDGTLGGLLHEMKNGGADYSVILPVVTNPKQFETINRTAVEMNHQYSGKILSFGGIHPDCENYKEKLRQITHMGLKGIKLHPDYQQTFIDDIKYLRMIDYASELGLIIVVHAGVDIGFPSPVHCTPKAARSLIDQVHPEKLVLAHMGGCNLWNEVDQYLTGQNVFFDTAFVFNEMKTHMFELLVEHHGVEHILFATDSPWCSQKDSIIWMQNTGLSKEQQDRIFLKNAQLLLK